MKRLILIRHGETRYTKEWRYCSHESVPLNKKGIAQAKRLCLKVKGLKIDRIYSSDTKRALQTSEIIFRSKKILKSKGLREIDFGRFCGKTIWEVSKRYPGINKIWLSSPIDVKIPGGESIRNFRKRVRGCLKRISTNNRGKAIAIVSHGGVLRMILLDLYKLGIDRFWDIKLNTAAFYKVEFKKGKAHGKVHLYSRWRKKR